MAAIEPDRTARRTEKLPDAPPATMKDSLMAPKPQALPVVLIPHPHVRVDQAILAGSPHVSGSRVPVRRIFGFYRDGTKIETIMRRFPQLGPARVLDALAFALDNPVVIEA